MFWYLGQVLTASRVAVWVAKYTCLAALLPADTAAYLSPSPSLMCPNEATEM